MSSRGPSAVVIELSDVERARLIGVSAESSVLAVRARIVLACAEPGAGNAQVGRDLGLSVVTVRRWRAAFAHGGLDALLDAPRDGRPKATFFHLHFTPTSSSWINQVERWFGFLADQKIRRGVHKSVQALEQDIRDWINDWNANPRPFIWTKTAEEILESLTRFCRRISGAAH